MKSLVFFLVVLTAACSGNPAGPSPTSAPSAPPVQVAPPPPPPPAPLYTRSGSGNSLVDVPFAVTRVEIRGTWSGLGTSNFIVRRVGGTSIINAILRELPNRTYVGSHAVSGGLYEIVSSENISSWVFTEIR